MTADRQRAADDAAETAYLRFCQHCRQCEVCAKAGGELTDLGTLCPVGAVLVRLWGEAKRRAGRVAAAGEEP